MEILWDAGEPASVRQVHTALNARRVRLAYSTVKAVLSNLTAKRLARRTESGRTNYFAPVESREAFRKRTVTAVIDSLLDKHREPLLAHLVDRLVSDEDDLREMERLLARKRATFGRK
jgi:predicted transcriptional regulator